MTRKEYMKSLEDALSPLPEKTREAALNFCQEMLDDRMEDGMDEETAVAAMESPVSIASRLGAEPGETVDMGNLKLPNREDYLEFARLSDAAMEGLDKALKEDEEPKQEKTEPEKKPEPQPKPQPAPEAPGDGPVPDIGQIVRQALDAARQGLEMGQRAMQQAMDNSRQEEKRQGSAIGEYEKKVLTCPVSQLKSVCLTCANLPIRVTACRGDIATLTYYTSAANPYTASVQNGVMLLESQGGGRGGVKFSMFRIRFFLENPQPTVELSLPEDALVDLIAHTTNGSVKISGLSALCQVDAQTSNSRIEIQDTVCKALQMKSSNARLVMINVSAKLSIAAKTSNARIEAIRTVSGEGMTLKTSNGRMVLSETAARRQLEAVTSNGSIQADHIAGGAVILKTSNSAIRGSLRGRQQDYAIDSGTSHGSNSLPKSQDGPVPLYVHTSNGSINIAFEG